MSHNPNPEFVRPKAVPKSKRYLITLPQADAEAFDALMGYYADLFGLKLTVGGIMRVALRELKNRLDVDFVKALVDSPKESMREWELMKAMERKNALDANYMTIDGERK